jgi:hypothetical protein
MKRVYLVIAMLVASVVCAMAQETNGEADKPVVYIGSNSNNLVSSNNGRLAISLNGSTFEIGRQQSEQPQAADSGSNISTSEAYGIIADAVNNEPLSSKNRVYFGFMGIGAPYFNHFAAFEFGTNTLVGLDYSAYTPEEADQMMFNDAKAFNFVCNMATINVALNKSRSLAFSMAIGMMEDRYSFMNMYTLEYCDAMMRPVALGKGYSKSQLRASYVHIPMTLDWTIGRDAFVAAGVNLDILCTTHLLYKKPKTIIEDTVTINPVQVGATLRVGWRRLYGYANYSFVDMFKRGTGPGGKRLSVGVGVWF